VVSGDSERFELYSRHYGDAGADLLAEIRRETYGADLGQASWIMLDEARAFFERLDLGPADAALEIACGSGGLTCCLARETGAACVGVDINREGIEAATRRARVEPGGVRVSFHAVDASRPLPFASGSFAAIFCNDSINHLPDRASVLREWHRLLKAGGRVLFTDPIVVTGQLSNDEMRARSSIGYFLFTPVGCNERLLREAGFTVEDVQDVTGAVASVSARWRDARSRRREALVSLEGAEAFDRLQGFLDVVHRLAAERRLSRFMYLGRRTDDAPGARQTRPHEGGHHESLR
jgi:SAM-dependent methyltransferase